MAGPYGAIHLFDSPYFTGTGQSDLVPGLYPVAINGRPYMLDTNPDNFQARWKHETIPLLRQQADQSSSPAESSLNPQGPWRRAQDSWHHGAGQTWRDRDADTPDKFRFRSSKGIDPWTRYELSLLNDTSQARSSSNTNLFAVVAGARLYFADGSTLRYTTDLSSWSSVTGYTGGTITSMCSDGYTVYWTDGADIWTTNTGTAAATSADTKNGTLVRYAKGRLMVAVGNVLYNIPTLGSAATMTFTHPNAQWTWTDVAAGSAVIFACGYAGDKSYIYRTQIKPDGTALDVPVQCGELPDGEIVRAIYGYLGLLFIGTDLGVRVAQVDGQGNVAPGPLIETGGPVYDFEGQGQYVWFTWKNYDASSTGLGRVDITAEVATSQYAYASDLMVTAQGAVSSVVTFTNLRVFTVQGAGIYKEAATPVASGTAYMGFSTFGIPDPKVALEVAVATTGLAAGASYGVYLQADAADSTQLGADDDVDGSTGSTFSASQQTGERFEVALTLSASGATPPTVTRWTLKVVPAPDDGPAEILSLPLLLHRTIDLRGTVEALDPLGEVALLSALRASRQIITVQYFSETYTGFVADFTAFPYGMDEVPGDGAWGVKGTCLVDIQRIT